MNTIWSGLVTLLFFLPFALGSAAAPQSGPERGACCAQCVCEPCPPGGCDDCVGCNDCNGCGDCNDCSEAPAPAPAKGCGTGCGLGGGCTR